MKHNIQIDIVDVVLRCSLQIQQAELIKTLYASFSAREKEQLDKELWQIKQGVKI